MKRVIKKIISILLLLIILITNNLTIIATEIYNSGLLSLEEFLISKGVDKDGDEKLSDEEWASVKNLYLRGDRVDLTEIEKAINLKEIELVAASLKGIKFENFKKLEKVSLTYCYNIEIFGNENLRYIEMFDSKLDNCKIENLRNLEYIFFDLCNVEKVDFSKIKNIKKITLDLGFVTNMNKINLDFTEFENLEFLVIKDRNTYEYSSNTGKYVNKYSNIIDNINISGLSHLKEVYLYNTYNCNIEFSGLNDVENLYIDNNQIYEMDFTGYKNLETGVISKFGETLGKNDFEINEMYIAKIRKGFDNCYSLELEKKENIVEIPKGGCLKISEEWGESSVNVIETGILEYKNGQIIAKSVGEQKIKVIDSLKREHEVLIKVVNKNINTKLDKSEITAEKIEKDLILRSNGELWKIISETTAEMIDENVKKYYISEEINIKEFTDEVKWFNIVNTLYNDNKLVLEYFNGNKIKIEDVKDIGELLYVTNDGELYEYELEYITEELKTKHIMDNVKEIINGRIIVLEDGKIFEKRGKEEYVEILFRAKDNRLNDGYYLSMDSNKIAYLTSEKEDEEIILKSPIVLTDVEHITNMSYYNNGVLIRVDVIIRTDGSIWLYNLRNGLTKITESTPSTDEEIPEIPEESFITNPEIKEKEIGNEECITGLKLNENGTVSVNEFISQNNLNNKYMIKICDYQDKELKEDSLMGTGTKVKLYDGDYLVKEYIVIIYGDTDGDAEITAKDALTLIKILNEKIEPESQAHVEAGKLSGETELTPADALRIIKHLNKKYEITQDI